MESIQELQQDLPDGVPETVHVEVCQKLYSTAITATVREHITGYLNRNSAQLDVGQPVSQFEDAFLQEHVESLTITDNKERTEVDLSKSIVKIHVFRLNKDGPAEEELEGEDLPAANQWMLPASEFQGLWENLVFDSGIKSQLLQYVQTTLLFSDQHVDHNVISWNRVILLHGPPGTGKTSLCKALAHKLSIQMSDRYSYGQLVEINSHSLFSKWFSESGKLVMKLFQKIQEMIDDSDALICVLIDEVESLTAARKACLSGSEPSDSIRVVNALLTQLDQIKKNPNVIILTTSNITGAIDLAFVDRADIKQYIGPPSAAAIYKIYESCIRELMRSGIVRPKENIYEFHTLEQKCFTDASRKMQKLKEIAVRSAGLSGRTLRKLPFIAHALFIQKPVVTFAQFLVALEAAVEKQFQERSELSDS